MKATTHCLSKKCNSKSNSKGRLSQRRRNKCSLKSYMKMTKHRQ
ncbi:unnamed protein product [Strongylus vulgaris]|uniref:Uncharacterized protein n=1 Tax=Strongylus vulgaris TaxID=40348 RepID=A0A3P7JDG6_STRVU|nr:unnamed protein product [Strongylus vulgaris]